MAGKSVEQFQRMKTSSERSPCWTAIRLSHREGSLPQAAST